MNLENMETLAITLIVKAPNQLIDDQTIVCESTWSIKRLKEHLSQVYPNKPPQNEQKLIYSGQLLNDYVILKDVLREYGGPKRIHTLHLVCTPKYMKNTQKTEDARTTPEDTTTRHTDELPATTINNNPTLAAAGNERASTFNPHDTRSYNAYQFMIMQQTYLQYMQHYMNIAHLQQYGVPIPGLIDPTIPYNQQFMQRQDLGSYQTNGVGDAAAGNDAQHMNHGAANLAATLQQQQFNAREQEADAVDLPVPAPAPPPQAQLIRDIGLNDDRDHRDWLEHFYMLCRIMIFISIVYFYSSATRFVVVFFTAICLYLYQIGFFRNVNINNNDINANERRPGDGVLAARRVRDVPYRPQVPPAAGTDNPDTPEYTIQPEREPSRLTVAWTFVTTFLASLLPEIPNVV